MLKSLLVPLDGSPVAESVLASVTAFARLTGATVTLCQVVEPIDQTTAASLSTPALLEPDQRAVERAQAYLLHLAKGLADSGLTVHTKVAIGRAAETIVTLGNDFDLIAMGTHGRSGLGRWVYGSVADKVLTAATVPVLLIRATAAAGPAVPAFQRLLVPLDGSDLAEAALALATRLAQQASGTLVLVQSIAWAAQTITAYPYGYGAGMDVAGLLEQAEADAKVYLDGVAERLRAAGVGVETYIRSDHAAAAITEAAQQHHADLIVMSTHGRSGLGRWVMGSVADRVLRSADRPVVLVRTSATEPAGSAAGEADRR